MSATGVTTRAATADAGGAPAGPHSIGRGAPPEDGLLAIGAAARLAGVSERTLRYYEELGLVAPAAHSPGGSRRYRAEQVERVWRIRELQELAGLNLEEIRALLERDDRRPVLRAAWEASEDPAERRAILAEVIAVNTALRTQLVAKRERIGCLIADLDDRLARCEELLAETLPPEVRARRGRRRSG